MNRIETSATRRASHASAIAALMLIVGLTPLLAVPTAACGFNDDWSYARMAFEVAQSGRFHYDGWSTAAVGPQAYWGAAFVRAFGQSHFVLRCSTMVLAAVSAGLIYGIGVLCQLTRASAFQAALAAMLCPVVFPLSASFMTDVPALTATLLALWLAVQFCRVSNPVLQTVLLLGVVLVGLLGGAIRQPIWLINLVVTPALFLIHPAPPRLRLLWSALILAGCAAVLGMLRHLSSQPLLISENLGRSVLLALHEPQATGRRAVHLFTTAVLLLTPMGLALRPLIRRVRPRTVWIVVMLTIAEMLPLGLFRNVAYLTPWVGNLITDWGILPEQTDMLGQKPRIFPIAVSAILLAWGLILFNAAALAGLVHGRLICRQIATRIRRPGPIDLLLLFAIAMIGLSVLRPLIVFDRYLLPALPVAIIALSSVRERLISLRPSRATWAAFALSATFGWAITFDYHACLRARARACATLAAAGIPRTAISAGLEFDGETQLLAAGQMNDPRLSAAAGYRPLKPNPHWHSASYWFWTETPAIEPRYVLSRQPLAGYHESGLQPIGYWTCFPPWMRTIHILSLDSAIQQSHLVRGAD